MAASPNVRPNRRGTRSREVVLDAAERLMAEHGYEAATTSAIVKASGIPISSLYHYFGSKNGVLVAVMERGAARFFAELPPPRRPTGDPETDLGALIAQVQSTLQRHPDFLRLLVVLAAQPPAGDAAIVTEVIDRVRGEALVRLRRQMAVTFGLRANAKATDRLARFALAAVDGAFIATQSDRRVDLGRMLEDLPTALVAIHGRLREEPSRVSAR
ncbi:MAG: TetR/AcrR family transcriptional regulator [Solirubrobacterales bacterium]|nr:TetR/AcrR family transcriptional regulator [Solirubrobacterales bacterium]